MLLSLHIENLAIIRKLDVDFGRGFMALTGETGAGKSIILDGIGMLLGAKAEKELIRYGSDRLMVSGLFDELSDRMTDELSERGVELDEDGTLMIQRTLSRDGRSSVKMNGRAVSLSVLKAVAPLLMSIHGQNDTGALADASTHINITDISCGNTQLLSEYSSLYEDYERISKEIRSITEKQSESERLREILEYQIKDIDSARLEEGEEEALIDKKVKIKNSEKISKNAEFVYKALRGSEKGSISYLLDRSITALSQISGVLPELGDYPEKLRDMLYQVDEIAEDVYAVLEDTEEDPTEALNRIESRLDKISKLKRKYGLTVNDILRFRDNAKEELDTIDNSEELLKKLDKEKSVAYERALLIADKLHSARVEGSKRLESVIKDTLAFLDMPKVVFYSSIKEEYSDGERKLGPLGYDNIEFFISANKGMEAQPISKIASGGELARIMLAIKTALADNEGVSGLIFDEIDAGVSGKTARKIGIKMLELSKSSQIFCVTHSAQIASLADKHFLIGKTEVDGVNETQLRELDDNGRINELSRILGGINVTDAQRAAAVDMLKERQNYS